MNINLFPFLVIGMILFTGVLGLIVWRKKIAGQEDDSLHVLDGGGANQSLVAQKLDQIDKWGKMLTIIVVVYGAVLACAYAYQVWVQHTQLGA